jgi:N-acetylglucosamine-6-sulfatase
VAITPYPRFKYILNDNGRLINYSVKPKNYGTDVYTRKAADFIQAAVRDRKPFFMYLSTYTPHGGIGDGLAVPAPRHLHLFSEVSAPRTPSFNEQNISDKPRGIRAIPLLTNRQVAWIDKLYRKWLQSLKAIDEMVRKLVNTPKTMGQLRNTYIVFTSDNGFHLGHHRLPAGKESPYEEDIRVPSGRARTGRLLRASHRRSDRQH